jgi:hypothetical protein
MAAVIFMSAKLRPKHKKAWLRARLFALGFERVFDLVHDAGLRHLVALHQHVADG